MRKQLAFIFIATFLLGGCKQVTQSEESNTLREGLPTKLGGNSGK